MNYLDYYNLNQEPFSIMPLTKFYFHSDQHDRALEKLQYAVAGSKGLAVLVGDIGTGKSLLARRLLDILPEDEYDASLLVILHSDVDTKWLLKRIALQLGVEDPSEEKVHILGQLYNKLVELSDEGKRAVVLIDEAHMLRTKELMEEFRGLLNLELPDKKLLTFVFFGMPELNETLKIDPALAQRVAVRHSLSPFDQVTTADYIKFRLNYAGVSHSIFTDAAMIRVHEYSKGVPRLINVVCDNALFEGYVRHMSPPIDIDVIDNVASDLSLEL
ncbi:AAA family ATPase [bacterium]|nr:AAA family ATPase [bacterium]